MTLDCMSQPDADELDAIHHVAVSVSNIGQAVDWYTERFRCHIVYQDETWAMLRFANMHLALVIPSQHPPHIGITHPHAERFGELRTHRDGSRSVYVPDPSGNSVEILDEASVSSPT